MNNLVTNNLLKQHKAVSLTQIVKNNDLEAANPLYNLIFFRSFGCHRMYSYITRMSFVCHSYVLVCHLYVTRMSSVCHSYVTCMSSVCDSYILVCHPYVTRMYSYVIRMSLVCTLVSSLCHLSVVLP